MADLGKNINKNSQHRFSGPTPLRHPIAPSLTVTGLRLVVTTDHTIGLPVLRASPL
jgi:hypothetical protein